MKRYEFELFTDYFQFYLQDKEVDGGLSASWTKEAIKRMLALAPGTIGVGTFRNVNVNAIVEVHEQEPSLQLDERSYRQASGLHQ